MLKLEIGLLAAKKMVQTIQFQMIEHFGEDDGQPERVAGDCAIAVEAIQKMLDDVVAPMLQLVRNATVDEMERRRKEEADGDK